MNRVFLIGYVGRKPEIVLGKNGRPYARLSVATHRSWMTADDCKQEQTEWHSVFVWGSLAEVCCAQLDRGSLVCIDGSLSYWKVKDKDYRKAIHGYEVRFLNAPISAVAEEGRENSPGVDKDARSRNHNAVAQLA